MKSFSLYAFANRINTLRSEHVSMCLYEFVYMSCLWLCYHVLLLFATRCCCFFSLSVFWFDASECNLMWNLQCAMLWMARVLYAHSLRTIKFKKQYCIRHFCIAGAACVAISMETLFFLPTKSHHAVISFHIALQLCNSKKMNPICFICGFCSTIAIVCEFSLTRQIFFPNAQ